MSKLRDFDIWFKRCEKCGFNTGRASKKSGNRCWRCGSVLQREFSDRALRKNRVAH